MYGCRCFLYCINCDVAFQGCLLKPPQISTWLCDQLLYLLLYESFNTSNHHALIFFTLHNINHNSLLIHGTIPNFYIKIQLWFLDCWVYFFHISVDLLSISVIKSHTLVGRVKRLYKETNGGSIVPCLFCFCGFLLQFTVMLSKKSSLKTVRQSWVDITANFIPLSKYHCYSNCRSILLKVTENPPLLNEWIRGNFLWPSKTFYSDLFFPSSPPTQVLLLEIYLYLPLSCFNFITEYCL